MNGRRTAGALRVLHVDAAREWRGAERQLLLLAQGLRARGAEPLLAVRPGSPVLHRLKAEGIATAALEMRSDLDLLAVRRLRRLIATWRPDLVHAHDRRGHALALGALIGRSRSVPLLVSRRTAARPRGLLRFGPRVARFIAISGAVRDGLAAGGVDAARIAVAYPGVSARTPEAPRDWRTECGWPAHTVVAGIIGPASHERGRDSLVRLLQSIPRNALDRLGVIVLGGHAQGAGEIAGVRAFRAGFVHDVPSALAGLDLLLHTGGPDGLGTAVVEAMALGVPSIAFDAGGLGEVIDHGVDGLLVRDGDDATFAARTAELVLDDARRAALGRAGPACARRYAPEVMVDTILRTYGDVLERSGV